MRGITKAIFLSAIQCRTLGWFLRAADGPTPPSRGDRFRMEQGSRIGVLARELYPGGVLVPAGAFARDETARLLGDPRTHTLFEATFVAGACTARADVLLRSESAWKVVEVKSNLADTDDVESLIADLAYTVLVARRSGLRISAASLLLLSRHYRKGMPTADLFVEVDQTAAVDALARTFDDVWTAIDQSTGGATRPAPSLVAACRQCAYFASDCLGQGIAHPILEIPHLQESRLLELGKQGRLGLDQLDEHVELTENQRRVVEAVRTNRPFVGDIRQALGGITWPASYLDFETTMTAIPLYEGLAPFEQVPTQFSIHRRSAPGAALEHVDYVSDPSRDCQRALAERLIRGLGDRGSIVVYSPFEKTRIRALAKRFADLAPKFVAIDARIFDLLPVVRKSYYHADFHGSYSIKDVLPVLVPELPYDGMEIGDGDAASATFALIAMRAYDPPESERLLEQLRAYCKQDTLAMVKLHEALLAL